MTLIELANIMLLNIKTNKNVRYFFIFISTSFMMIRSVLLEMYPKIHENSHLCKIFLTKIEDISYATNALFPVIDP